MSENKIYVGNLSFNTTQEELTDEFSQFGELTDVKLIIDRETGRSKGFAFLTYSSQDGMQAALEMNGREVGGRPLRVNQAEERRPR